MGPILFLKSIIRGAGQVDLFATPTVIDGHVRADGQYVAPYTAIRHVAPAEPAADPARLQLEATRAGLARDVETVSKRWRVLVHQAESAARAKEPGRGHWFGRAATTWTVRQERWFQAALREGMAKEAPNLRGLLKRIDRTQAAEQALAAKLRLNEPWQPHDHDLKQARALLELGQGPERLGGSDAMRALAKPPPTVLFVRKPEVPPADAPDLASYDHVLVMFSGGKDSVASVIRLLELGVDRSKIELWHHDIDGDGRNLMDWPITPDYCRAFARAIGVPIYFSFREGGFEREMNRHDQATAAVIYEKPDGTSGRSGGVSNKLGTREKFPQTSANLAVRWCSGSLKVDVGAAAIRGQERFLGKRTLVVTGERGEESANRAKYKTLEPDRTSTQSRHVDHYRPVHAWTEGQVWNAFQRNGIVPHPAYQLGYGRLSCRNCIFGSPDQWATNRALYPDSVGTVADYEQQYNTTIHRTETVHQRADKGTPYAAAVANPALASLADSKSWGDRPILVDPASWTMPAGAYAKDKSGPT